jgi:hypothetical protein
VAFIADGRVIPGAGTRQPLRFPITQARLASSLIGVRAAQLSVFQAVASQARLTPSLMVTGMLKDVQTAQLSVLQSIAPQARLAPSLMAAGMLKNVRSGQANMLQLAVVAALRANLLPSPSVTAALKDFNVKLAGSVSNVGMLRSVNEAAARLVMTSLSPVRSAAWLNDPTRLQLAAAVAARLAESHSIPDTELDTFLSRNQKRALFAYFFYLVVLSVTIMAVIDIMNEGERNSALLALFTTVTGYSGHSLAKVIRDLAFRLYDYLYPGNKS